MPIVESWRRTIAAGVDPTQRRAPIDFAEDEAKDRLAGHRLGRLVSAIMAKRETRRSSREFSRLRRLLGARLETDPYRLAGPVRSDLLALRQRLP